MTKVNLIKIEKLLQSNKAILVNNKLVKRVLGFDDMRDFCQDLHNWGYCRDFTYQSYKTEDWQRYLRLFLRETYLD